jgi:hypothetical protein
MPVIDSVSPEKLFETQVHCLYLLNQFNKAADTEERQHKHRLNNECKEKIIAAESIRDIKNILVDVHEAIHTKKHGLLWQKINDCLNIPAISSLTPSSESFVLVMRKAVDSIYPIKLKCCIPLLEYSLSHPEHSINDLINNIRQARDVDEISNLIAVYKSDNVKPKRLLSSVFSRDNLSTQLEKSIEILNSLKDPVLKNS